MHHKKVYIAPEALGLVAICMIDVAGHTVQTQLLWNGVSPSLHVAIHVPSRFNTSTSELGCHARDLP